MRYLVRVAAVLLVAIVVGWYVDRLMLRHNSVPGAYEPQVRLGAATAGLFTAGAAATLVGIGMAVGRKK